MKGKTTVLECMIPQKRGRNPGVPPSLEVNISETEKKIISYSGICRILEINFQLNRSWFSHLESGEKALLLKIRKQIGVLKHLEEKIPRSSRKILANSLILSRFSYLVAIWGSSTDNHTRRAQILLNTAAHWVSGLGKKTRIRNLMESVGWLTINVPNCLRLYRQYPALGSGLSVRLTHIFSGCSI